MTTFTYNAAGLSVKDRLTISNLLGLFESRLNAKWVSTTSPDKPAQAVLIDIDQPQGLEQWGARSKNLKGTIAVTENDRWPEPPFISRPIRAYGPAGVVVLFNSIAQSPSAPADGNGTDLSREPARMRMAGRLEAPAAVVAVVWPPAPPPVRSTVPRTSSPPPPIHPAAVQPPVTAKAAVRWGPPERIILPPLTCMPGARIHAFGQRAWQPEALDAPPYVSPRVHDTVRAVTEPRPEPLPARSWSVPTVETPTRLIDMPIAHRPVEIHGPSAPLIGRARLEALEPKPVPTDYDAPFLRPAPSEWRAPKPEQVESLIDFRSAQDLPILDAPVQETPVLSVPEAEVDEPTLGTLEMIAAPVVEAPETTVLPDTEIIAQDTEPTIAPDAEATVSADMEIAEEKEIQALFADVQQNLETLSHAIEAESYPEQLPAGEADVDWWGAQDLEDTSGDDQPKEPAESSLLTALKSIKASGQPGIIEIAGLPAVCVIPARNTYFTTAPAARIETAINARSDVSRRTCSSESEARQISGTEQSRQASLEHLFWTASLITPSESIAAIADEPVRLRRWPPITESRGRSKYLRYATLLSGAQATPREIAEITGDTVEEIACFVNACSRMNLLETSGQTKAPVAHTPTRNGGAGILRGMIEQLTPPKI
jgi:hypothetical protein